MLRFQMAFWAAVSFALATPSLASDAADQVVEQARQDCQAFENGVLETTDDAVTLVDLTADGQPNEIVDAAGFRCSTGNLFCGTGGCSLTVLVDETPTEFLAKAWRVIEWGSLPILLLEVHGSACGGTNLRSCFEAVVWSEGGFRSVRPE